MDKNEFFFTLNMAENVEKKIDTGDGYNSDNYKEIFLWPGKFEGTYGLWYSYYFPRDIAILISLEVLLNIYLNNFQTIGRFELVLGIDICQGTTCM